MRLTYGREIPFCVAALLEAPKEIACNRSFLPFFCWAAMGESCKYEITVTVRTQYLPEQSNEAAARFVFAYHITIVNTGTETAQLLARHWLITEADGKVQEVRGQGVVGEQPILKPDEAFEYTSGVAIGSPVGTMRGSYHFMAENGQAFDAEIGEFVLSVPRVLH